MAYRKDTTPRTNIPPVKSFLMIGNSCNIGFGSSCGVRSSYRIRKEAGIAERGGMGWGEGGGGGGGGGGGEGFPGEAG